VIFTDPLRRNTADRVFGHSDFNAGGNPLSPYVTIPPTTARNLLRPRTLAFDGAGACTWRTRSTTGCCGSTVLSSSTKHCNISLPSIRLNEGGKTFMKKKVKKLLLSRETLKRLETRDLNQVAGASVVDT